MCALALGIILFYMHLPANQAHIPAQAPAVQLSQIFTARIFCFDSAQAFSLRDDDLIPSNFVPFENSKYSWVYTSPARPMEKCYVLVGYHQKNKSDADAIGVQILGTEFSKAIPNRQPTPPALQVHIDVAQKQTTSSPVTMPQRPSLGITPKKPDVKPAAPLEIPQPTQPIASEAPRMLAEFAVVCTNDPAQQLTQAQAQSYVVGGTIYGKPFDLTNNTQCYIVAKFSTNNEKEKGEIVQKIYMAIKGKKIFD